jgi:hypothetical protein
VGDAHRVLVSHGCASGSALGQRGALVTSGEVVKAFAAGPAIVHAYAMDGGGRLFTAPAISGTDADCVGARAEVASATRVETDRRNVITLATGEVACVASNGRRGYELLWRARPVPVSNAQIVVAQALHP